MDFRKNRVAKKILMVVEEVSLRGDGLSLNFKNSTDSNPGVRQFIKWYLEQTRQEKYRIRKIFTELKKQNLIEFIKNRDNESRIILSEAGKNALLYKKLSSITIAPQKKWDQKWRIILFSLPNNMKQTRNLFCSLLKNLKFTLLRDGARIHPLSCKSEIETISDILKIRPYINFIETPSLDCDENIKKKALSLFF